MLTYLAAPSIDKMCNHPSRTSRMRASERNEFVRRSVRWPAFELLLQRRAASKSKAEERDDAAAQVRRRQLRHACARGRYVICALWVNDIWPRRHHRVVIRAIVGRTPHIANLFRRVYNTLTSAHYKNTFVCIFFIENTTVIFIFIL